MRRFKKTGRKKGNTSRLNLKKILTENWRFIVLFALFIAGLILGAMIAKNGSLGTLIKVDAMFGNYMEIRGSQSLLMCFINAIAPSFLLLCLTYFCGLSAAGFPIILLIPVFRGLGIGLLSGYLYNVHAMKGITYCGATIFPQTSVMVIVLMVGCIEAMRMSTSVASMFRRVPASAPARESIRVYTGRFLTLLLILIVAAMAEVFLVTVFSKVFSA